MFSNKTSQPLFSSAFIRQQFNKNRKNKKFIRLGLGRHQNNSQEDFFQDLIKRFQLLPIGGEQTDCRKLAIEQERLAIMLAILNHLKKNMQQTAVVISGPEQAIITQNNRWFKRFWKLFKRIGFKIAALGTLIGGGADGFLSAFAILGTAPAIVTLIVSIFFMGIAIILSYLIDVRSLKEELGLTTRQHIGSIAQIHKKQIDLQTAINHLLLVKQYDTTIPYDQYCTYGVAAKLSHALIIKRNQNTIYQEPMVRKIARLAIGMVGGTMIGGFAFFSIGEAAKGVLLLATALGLFTTLPGWVMIAMTVISIFVAVCAGGAYFATTQKLGLFNLFNPEAEKIKELHKSVATYKKTYHCFDFDIEGAIARRLSDKMKDKLIAVKNKKIKALQKKLVFDRRRAPKKSISIIPATFATDVTFKKSPLMPSVLSQATDKLKNENSHLKYNRYTIE